MSNGKREYSRYIPIGWRAGRFTITLCADGREVAMSLVRWGFVLGAVAGFCAPAAASDLLAGCAVTSDSAYCANVLAKARKEVPLAKRGDYQAMRNVAFCLGDAKSASYEAGCDGAYVYDPVGSCAWRLALVALHGARGTDAANLRRECRLEQFQIEDASARASVILGAITKKTFNLPLVLERSGR